MKHIASLDSVDKIRATFLLEKERDRDYRIFFLSIERKEWEEMGNPSKVIVSIEK